MTPACLVDEGNMIYRRRPRLFLEVREHGIYSAQPQLCTLSSFCYSPPLFLQITRRPFDFTRAVPVLSALSPDILAFSDNLGSCVFCQTTRTARVRYFYFFDFEALSGQYFLVRGDQRLLFLIADVTNDDRKDTECASIFVSLYLA